jgi:hypothetical protein
VTGLLLAHHSRTKKREDPAGAVSRQSTYLYQNSYPAFGLGLMTIILSLPWSLLCGRMSSQLSSSIHVHETSPSG